MTPPILSAQVSLYPLRQQHLSPAITCLLDGLRGSGLDVRPGRMSSVISGEAAAVFDALKAAFVSAAALGDVVMVVTCSNCCPPSRGEPGDV